MVYEPDVITKLEALYEPGETSLYMSDWSYNTTYQEWHEMGLVTDAHWEEKVAVNTATVALTEERLYFVWFVKKNHLFSRSTMEVHTFWSIPLASIVYHSFDKMKNAKGALLSYQFTFQSAHPNAQYLPSPIFGAPSEAESFMEHFRAAMARFAALAAPVDLAAQLRALQALADDGILTHGEMQRAKDLFLGRPPDQRQLMERNLRSLHELRKSGVLNQIEFDIKKQDILATAK